jgi:hypothetical protein
MAFHIGIVSEISRIALVSGLRPANRGLAPGG